MRQIAGYGLRLLAIVLETFPMRSIIRRLARPTFLAPLLLLACVGPGGGNSPQEQVIADALHEDIIDSFLGYRVENGRKVLYACIDWSDRSRPIVYNLDSNYTENSNYVASIMHIMRNSARGACETRRSQNNFPCTCQLADESGRNMIEVPDGASTPAPTLSSKMSPWVEKTAQ